MTAPAIRRDDCDPEANAKVAWNAGADEFNQWPDLGQDERDGLIEAQRKRDAES